MTEIKKKPATIRKRHSQRQRKRIRMMKIRRTIFFMVLALILILVLMFATPIFNIRSVVIEGNEKIETREIEQCIGDVQGKNLFKAKVSAMKKSISKIPYIEDVSIDRVIFKSRLVVSVVECQDAACIAVGDGYIIIDTEAKVLAEVFEKPQNIPEVTGLSITNISTGEKLGIEEKDKFNIMLKCLDEMHKIDILKGVRTLSVADMGNITFNYEDRLDAICGSSVDLTKKLGFFKSAINSSELTENSRGTIDLTTAGKAVYTP